LGGDEFEILYCGDDLKELIGRAIEKLHDVPGIEALTDTRKISLSAGFTSTSFDESIDLDALYKAADEALYAAKQDREPSAAVSCRTGTWRI